MQEIGLDILQRTDVLRANQDDVTQIKLAYLTKGEDPRTLWPEHFTDAPTEISVSDDMMNPDTDYDYSAVEFLGGADMERDAALLAEFMGQTQVTVTGSEEWV